MNRPLTITTLAFLCLGIVMPASDAVGQQKTLKELIVGTWLLDSVYASNNPRSPVGQAVGYFGTYTVDEAAKTVTYHIERATFPQWDGIDRTANIAIATENEFDQTSAPVQDPSLGTVIPHLKFKRAM